MVAPGSAREVSFEFSSSTYKSSEHEPSGTVGASFSDVMVAAAAGGARAATSPAGATTAEIVATTGRSDDTSKDTMSSRSWRLAAAWLAAARAAPVGGEVVGDAE